MKNVWMYSAKVVCTPILGNPLPALTIANYRTAVNVHNPWPDPVEITKWVTLSPPQGQPAISGDRIDETLPPFGAFDVDCPHMRDDFGLPVGAKVPGGKGFLVVQATRNIDVAAVYTSRAVRGGKDGIGTSVDVEYIEPKTFTVNPLPPPPPGKPDLTVQLTDPPTTVECIDVGTGDSCTASFKFDVTNIGTGDSPSFVTKAEVIGFGDSLIGSGGGLGTGDSKSFMASVLLGPTSCYDPDCTVRVTVDHLNDVDEQNEANNVDERTDPG